MDILYEDNHLIAINKHSGDIVQGDKTGDLCMADAIKAFIKQRDNKPGNVFCGVIHRLDRPVSGVVLFAKTSKALARMNVMIQQHEVHKTYWCLVRNCPPKTEDTLSNYLVRNERLNKSFVVDANTPNAKQASLSYKLIGQTNGGYYLLEVELHTGRHHQIRCQLANIGCPIKGDLKYGASRSNPDGSISLHAHSVAFVHPVSQADIVVVAPWHTLPEWHKV